MNKLLYVLMLLLANSVQAGGSGCRAPAIKNGRYKWKGGYTTLQYKCNRRYTRVGVRFSLCVGSSHLEPPEPPLCVSSGCETLMTPANGHLVWTVQDAYVELVCDFNHILVGSNSIHCDGRHWNDTLGICKPRVAKTCSSTLRFSGWQQSTMDDGNWIFEDDNFKFQRRAGQDLVKSLIYSPIYLQLHNFKCVSFTAIGQLTRGRMRAYLIPENSADLSHAHLLGDIQDGQTTFNLRGQDGNFHIGVLALGGGGFDSDVELEDACLATSCSVWNEVREPSDSVAAKPWQSCQGRCDFDPEKVPDLWIDSCLCSESCHFQNTSCCDDFHLECPTLGALSYESGVLTQLGLSWNHIIYIGIGSGLMILTVIFALVGYCTSRTRDPMSKRNVIKSDPDNSDMDYMMMGAAVDDDSEDIDFNLAKPCDHNSLLCLDNVDVMLASESGNFACFDNQPGSNQAHLYAEVEGTSPVPSPEITHRPIIHARDSDVFKVTQI